MFVEIQSKAEFERMKNAPALLGYFSTDTCNVCKVLKPKVEEMNRTHFPRMKLAYVKLDLLPEIAGQHRVFSAPTILVFFEGREAIRKSRSIGVKELKHEIERFYDLLFRQ